MVGGGPGEPTGRLSVGLVSVVDDDASVLRSLENLLVSTGLRVETFGSAEAFLASDHLAETGCLVLDLRMPGMSGLELFSRLTVAAPRIRVIILTAVTNDDERERLLRQGAVAVFTKPFRAADMLLAVRGALGMSAGPVAHPSRGR
jgi:FixJ family two-component response regulator